MQEIWTFLDGIYTQLAAMGYRQAPIILLALTMRLPANRKGLD